eukprot:Em0008g366a
MHNHACVYKCAESWSSVEAPFGARLLSRQLLFNYGALPGNVQHELEEGPLSSTLSVLGTSAGNQGLYTCVANSAVRSMSSSSTSFVNVIDPPLLLSVEPTFLRVLVGSGVVLKCTAQQPCLGSQPAFQWSRQGRKALSSQAKIETKDDGSVLKIDHVTRDDDGVYYCHAALLECYSTEITSPCLELPVPVIVKVTSLQSLPVPAGSPMRFLCEASTHTASLHWVYNGEIVSAGGGNGHFVVRNISNASSLLVIYETVLSDTGTLTCLSDVGISSSPVHITIVFTLCVDRAARASGTSLGMETTFPAAVPAPTASSASSSTVSSLKVSDIQRSSVSISAPLQLSLFPSDIRLKVGQSADLLCEATSAVMLTWLFRYTSFLPGNVEVVEGPTKSSLTIHNMTADNGGEYVCVATLAGSSPLYAIASVIFLGIPPLLPTISIVPGVLSIAEGLSANFTCNSSQPAQFVWVVQCCGAVAGQHGGSECDLYSVSAKGSWKGLMLGGGSLHFREGHKMWQV